TAIVVRGARGASITPVPAAAPSASPGDDGATLDSRQHAGIRGGPVLEVPEETSAVTTFDEPETFATLRPGPPAAARRAPLPTGNARPAEATASSGPMIALILFAIVFLLYLFSVPKIGFFALFFAPLCGGIGYLIIKRMARGATFDLTTIMLAGLGLRFI